MVHEDFRGGENDLGRRIILDIPGENPKRNLRVLLGEIVEFLVGKALDGARIDDLFTLTDKILNGEIGGHRLTIPRGRGHQCMVPVHDSLDRIFLKIGERKREPGEMFLVVGFLLRRVDLITNDDHGYARRYI